MKDRRRVGCRRAVRRFTDDIRFDSGSIFTGDLVFDCRRNQHITVHFKNFLVADDIIEQVRYHAEAVTTVEQIVDIQPFRIVQSAVGI